MDSRIAASVGAGPVAPESRKARPDISMPGVQIPHWTPPLAMNAACSGSSRPSAAMPSTVRTSRPSTWQMGTRQLSTTSPSRSTEHAPHSPSPQPSFEPVSPRSRRRTSRSRRPPGTTTSIGCPLTVKRSGAARLLPGRHAWGRSRAPAPRPARGGARPRRARSAASTRAGVAGSSVIQAPVASWMASITAGAPTSIGSSPRPLAPCGASGNGASTKWASIAGASIAVGIR